MKNPKPNIKPGNYDLIVSHFKPMKNGGKICFFFRPIFHSECADVQRTFVQASEALSNFIYELTGTSVPIAAEAICHSIRGKSFVGKIVEAKDPRYVDLAYIIKVHTTMPAKPYNNSSNPVIDSESDIKKGRSIHAGQTST